VSCPIIFDYLPTCNLVNHLLFHFFFLMIRRPPRSTLFPTRRSSDLYFTNYADWPATCQLHQVHGSFRMAGSLQYSPRPGAKRKRSEEHTSELQSRRDLVCRLLLEKKKKNKQRVQTTETGDNRARSTA